MKNTHDKTKRIAAVGVVENANTAVLVTVASAGGVRVLDRRTVELTEGLSTHPHHHEGSLAVGRYLKPDSRKVTLAEAVALVERVREAAERGAREALDTLAEVIHMPIASIAIRECPEMPATIEARIADNRAQSYADSVMYRRALAAAAEARGWAVHWYDRDRVVQDAALLNAMGKAIGSPWQAKHKLAAAAALEVLAGNTAR